MHWNTDEVWKAIRTGLPDADLERDGRERSFTTNTIAVMCGDGEAVVFGLNKGDKDVLSGDEADVDMLCATACTRAGMERANDADKYLVGRVEGALGAVGMLSVRDGVWDHEP